MFQAQPRSPEVTVAGGNIVIMSVGRGTNNIKGSEHGFCSKIKQRRILSAVNPKLQYWVSISNVILDGLDFEVETNERKYQTFQILNKVVECSEAFWIFTLVDINERSNF
jgi:hypothetical protein